MNHPQPLLTTINHHRIMLAPLAAEPASTVSRSLLGAGAAQNCIRAARYKWLIIIDWWLVQPWFISV